jgi:hypothetical protein
VRPRATYLILPLYLVASLIFTWPLVQHFKRAIPSGHLAADPAIQAFILGWDARSLLTNPLQLFHPPIFFPERNTLTYMDHLVGETISAAPAFVSFHSVAAGYNFLLLLSFVVSGWAVYRLTRLFGVSRAGAFLAGFLFSFSPYRFANLDLLNQLQTQFLPLGLFFGVRYLRRFRTRDLAGIAGTMVLQLLFGWYYAYYLAIALVLLFAYSILRGDFRMSRGSVAAFAAAIAISALLTLPFILPYIHEHRILPEFRRSLGESALYSADILDYFKLSATARIAQLAPLATGAQSYWPGIVTVLLAFVGTRETWLRGAKRLGEEGYFAALAAVSFILSLGPVLHVAGARIWIPLPYVALYYVVPGFSSMRAPARFASLVILSLSVLAGVGFERLRDRWGPRPMVWRSTFIATFLVAVLCAWPSPLSLVELPSSDRLPPVYAWLSSHPGAEPLLEIPVPASDGDENGTHAIRQFYLLYHGHPRLDGSSGFVSRRYRRFRSEIQSFPSQEALQVAGEMGAGLVVVHFQDYPLAERESLRRAIAAERRLTLKADCDSDAVYELRLSVQR